MCIVHEGGVAQANQHPQRARARRHRAPDPSCHLITPHAHTPEAPPLDPPWRPTSPVSLRFTYVHLLSHTSGLNGIWFPNLLDVFCLDLSRTILAVPVSVLTIWRMY